MCKYCEEIYKQDGRYICYVKNENNWISYDTIAKEHNIEAEEAMSVISHCPWCGRKLEPLEDTLKESDVWEAIVDTNRKIQCEVERLDALCDALAHYTNTMMKRNPHDVQPCQALLGALNDIQYN